MEIRTMLPNEFERFREIDRREIIEGIYYFRNEGLELEDEYVEVPEWTESKKQKFIDGFYSLYNDNGRIYGAFDGNTLAGMATLDTQFMGEEKNQLNLAGLWVTRNYRKKGVGTALLNHVIQQARSLGAKSLYVSATESYNTVHFYFNRGFKLVEKVDKRLYEKEPMDIHMELDISSID